PMGVFFHFLFSLLYLPALFTEVPRDVTTQIGEDVEMACSFHGAGSPSFSLEIQWWYIKNHKDSQGLVGTLEEMPKDATKISVVKVAGSNISHKLRLSGVKPADEGTYECHVIDHSGPVEQRYRVQAYLRVEPDRLQESDDAQLQELEHPSRGSRFNVMAAIIHSINLCLRFNRACNFMLDLNCVICAAAISSVNVLFKYVIFFSCLVILFGSCLIK
uniref:V-set and transmembrane domain-containing protein 2-like protein n=1 Tax=Poecilia latipinna TaxID=48699 RepID=A0A3B3VT99_9TELE